MTQFCRRKELSVEYVGEEEVFVDTQTGLRIVGSTEPDSVLPLPYTLEVEEPGRRRARATHAFRFEKRFLPSIPATEFDDAKWDHDSKPKTPGTGGARRNYVSVPLYTMLRGATKDLRIRAFDAEIGWNTDQMNRPLSHQPFLVSGDGYSQKWVNRGTDREWNHKWATQDGWNAFDYAHCDYARSFSLASLDHPLGYINQWLVWRWLVLSARGTNWLTQRRSIGWVLNWGVNAYFLDFGVRPPTHAARDAYCEGITPQAALQRWVDQILGDDFQEHAATYDKPSNHNMPVLDRQDWHGTGPQCLSTQFFHWGLMLWGVSRLLASGLLDGYRSRLMAFVDNELDIIMDRAWDERGMSRAALMVDLETEQLANMMRDECEAVGPARIDYETHQLKNGKWIVREVPRQNDSELLAAPVAVMYGPDHQIVQDYIAFDRGLHLPRYSLVIAAAVENEGPLIPPITPSGPVEAPRPVSVSPTSPPPPPAP